jgi:hypothetical protein
MEFPDDVLTIIKAYAQPITRPDWRRLHHYTSLRLHLEIAILFNTSISMASIFFIKNQTSKYIYYVEHDDSGPYVRYLVHKQNVYKIECI